MGRKKNLSAGDKLLETSTTEQNIINTSRKRTSSDGSADSGLGKKKKKKSKLADNSTSGATSASINELLQAANLTTKRGLLQKGIKDSKSKVESIMNNIKKPAPIKIKKEPPGSSSEQDIKPDFNSAITSTQIPMQKGHSRSKINILDDVTIMPQFRAKLEIKQEPKSSTEDSETDSSNSDSKKTQVLKNNAKNVNFTLSRLKSSSSSESEDDNEETLKNVFKSLKSKQKSSSDEDTSNFSQSKTQNSKNPPSSNPKQKVVQITPNQDENDNSSDSSDSSAPKKTQILPRKNVLSQKQTSSSDDSDSDSARKQLLATKNVLKHPTKAHSSSSDDSDSEPQQKTKPAPKAKQPVKNRKSSSSDSSSESDTALKPAAKQSKTASEQKTGRSSNAPQKDEDSSSDDSSDEDTPKVKNKPKPTVSISKPLKGNGSLNKPTKDDSSSDESSSDEDNSPKPNKNGGKSPNKSIIRQKKDDTSSSDDSSSDEETTKPTKITPKKVITKKKDVSSSNDDSSDEEISRRNEANKSKNAKESSSNESSDEDVKSPAKKSPNKWKMGLKKSNEASPKKRLKESELLIENFENGNSKFKEILINKETLIESDEELYLLQIPKSIQPELLKNTLISLGGKTKIKVGKIDYVVKPTNEKNESVYLLNNDVKKIDIKANLKMERKLKDSKIVNVSVPVKSKAELPLNLKTRHPLFGAEYSPKIKLDVDVTSKLNDTKVKKIKKKKLKNDPLNLEEDKNELIFKMLEQHSNKKNKKNKIDLDSEKNSLVSKILQDKIKQQEAPPKNTLVAQLLHDKMSNITPQKPPKIKKQKKDTPLKNLLNSTMSDSNKSINFLSDISRIGNDTPIVKKKHKSNLKTDAQSSAPKIKEEPQTEFENSTLITSLLESVKNELNTSKKDVKKAKKKRKHSLDEGTPSKKLKL